MFGFETCLVLFPRLCVHFGKSPWVDLNSQDWIYLVKGIFESVTSITTLNQFIKAGDCDPDNGGGMEIDIFVKTLINLCESKPGYFSPMIKIDTAKAGLWNPSSAFNLLVTSSPQYGTKKKDGIEPFLNIGRPQCQGAHEGMKTPDIFGFICTTFQWLQTCSLDYTNWYVTDWGERALTGARWPN